MDTDEETTSLSLSNELAIYFHEIIEGNQKSIPDQYQLNFNEFDTLRFFGNFLKLTPQNVEIISKNSSFFKELQHACVFYIEILESTEIIQQNFLNILILDYLLTNITSSNVVLYSIYANLFLIEMDIESFYQIVFNHCHGNPNSIYELAYFIKECNDINDHRKLLKKAYLSYADYFLFDEKWTIGILGFFLYHFNLLEKPDLIQYYEFKCLNLINPTVFNNKEFFERVIKRDVNDLKMKCILIDDVDTFGIISSNEHFDYDEYIKKPIDITSINDNPLKIEHGNTAIVNDIIYWPFSRKERISLIELSAFAGSLKIFKFLLLNHAEVNRDLINYAISGGNLEIIHNCEHLNCEINLDSFEMSIRYHHLNIFIWLVDNNLSFVEQNINEIAVYTIKYSNAQAFLILLQHEFSFPNVFMDTFSFMEREWVKFFISQNSNHQYFDFKNDHFLRVLFDCVNFKTFKILYEELNGNINITLNEIRKSMNVLSMVKSLSYRTIEYYFYIKGELNKNQDELIYPPFSNQFIFDYIKSVERGCECFVTSNYSQRFILFLMRNNAVNYNKYLTNEKICNYLINTDQFELLKEMSEKLPKLNELAYFQISEDNWYHFVFSHTTNKKLYFFQNCLKDTEENLSFQTEGLHYACFYGDYVTVEQLLSRRFIDVNSKEFDNGRTPLNLASECNFFNIVYLLINDERVRLNSFSDDHETSFYLACKYNYIELVDLFLKNREIDINIANKKGMTPLSIACRRGNFKVVKKLLNRPDLILNTSCDNNDSPLNLAILNLNTKIVKLLINDVRIKITYNSLKLACFKGNLEIVKLLFTIISIDKNIIDDIFFLLFN